MAYLLQDVGTLKARIDFALASRRLNGWQTRFLGDIKGRIEKYGPRTRLSAKQIEKLREIVGAEVSALEYIPFEPAHVSSDLRWQRRGSRLLAREGWWWAR